jgi:hypothetical protein
MRGLAAVIGLIGAVWLVGCSGDNGNDVAGNGDSFFVTPPNGGTDSIPGGNHTDSAGAGGGTPQCDSRRPDIALVGVMAVTINTSDYREYAMLMNLDGGPVRELVTWDTVKHPEVAFMPPKLTRGGNDMVYVPSNKTPEVGIYVIIYRLEKPECNGIKPSIEITRRLTVVDAPAGADTVAPKIALAGDKTVRITQGNTASYRDEGVTVTLAGAPHSLDSIVVTGSGSYRQKVTTHSEIRIPPDAVAEYSYTITYYASNPNNSSRRATETRTVRVDEPSVGPTITPVIILKPYTHKLKNGTTVLWPDTMLVAGSTNNDYKEKGVEEVYYESSAGKTVLDNNLVTVTLPSSFITGGAAGQKRVNYRIPSDDSKYTEKIEYRNVYLVGKVDVGNEECGYKADPVINFVGTEALEIPKDTPWNHESSWSVTNKDAPSADDPYGYGAAGYKYFIYMGTPELNWREPAPGTYTITYVGLGRCGSTAERTRTVTVR